MAVEGLALHARRRRQQKFRNLMTQKKTKNQMMKINFPGGRF
jgi:hypothetical protein